MEKNFALLVVVLILLSVAHFFGADLQVKANKTANSDPEISSDDLKSNSNNSEDGSVQVDDVNKKIKLSGETNPKKVQITRKVVSAESDNNQKKNKKMKKELNVDVGLKNKVNEEAKTNVDQSDQSNKGSDRDLSVQNGSGKDYDSEAENSIVDPKENRESKGNEEEEEEDSKKTTNKKESENGNENKVDECYSSDKCSDKNNELIACLRVPGYESPHLSLSLLIQNKGIESLTVDISAPAFVVLQSTQVQLQQKETKKIEVSIRDGGVKEIGATMALKSGDRVCNIDLKGIMASHRNKYLRFPTRRPTLIVILCLSSIPIAALVWALRRSRGGDGKRRVFGRHKVGPELPVGGVSKQHRDQKRSDGNEGWDDGWGDDWDDEEAPLTPSRPSPSFSSNRFASRRLIKENRKD